MQPALFKRYFLSAFVAYNVVLASIGMFLLITKQGNPSWLGVTIAALQVAIFFGSLYIRKPARTSRLLFGITLIIIGFTIHSVYESMNFKDGNDPTPGFAFITCFGWIAYLLWYSELERKTSKLLKVGNKLPDLLFENTDKTTVSTKSYHGNPTLYLFYRGNWCPLCVGQIDELYKNKEKFKERGMNMVFISPQAHSKSAKLAARMNEGFHFLADVGNKAATKLGILQKGAVPFGFEVLGFEADAPYPTVIITDAKGKIIYLHDENNYRMRPEVSELLNAINTKD